MYKPKYFQWYEFMPSKEYEPYWLILMDERILITADEIREYYGVPVTINNWYWGGNLKNRGFREMNTAIGAKLSQHKFGRAFDFDVKNVPAEQVRNDIRKGKFPLITCIEKGVNWVHADVRNVKRLFEVNP